jgi:hypothetical protein
VIRCLNRDVASSPVATHCSRLVHLETVKSNSYWVRGALVCCCMSSCMHPQRSCDILQFARPDIFLPPSQADVLPWLVKY